jgi:hypothetical protein
VFFSHLDIFFWKDIVKFICPFLHRVIDFLEFAFLSSLYILVISPLSDI